MSPKPVHEPLARRPGTIASLTLALLLLTVLSGCRTYGGYGTEVATVVAIEEANEQFARSLARAEGDLTALREAAEAEPGLSELAQEYGRVVSEQDSLLAVHRQAYANLTARRFGYRASSRLLGSIVTDHHRIADQYLMALGRAAAAEGRYSLTLRSPAQYQQVPPDLLRLEYRLTEPTLSDVIRPGV